MRFQDREQKNKIVNKVVSMFKDEDNTDHIDYKFEFIIQMFHRVHRLMQSNNNILENVDKTVFIYNRRKNERWDFRDGSMDVLIK